MKKNIYTYGGINFYTPQVQLLSSSPITNAEIGMRTCYNSFHQSENEGIRDFKKNLGLGLEQTSSKKVDNVANVMFHASILEHINFTFFITDTNRAVLQELSRHSKIIHLSVQSTRYCVSDIIKFYFIALEHVNNSLTFYKLMEEANIFNITNKKIVRNKTDSIYNSLHVAFTNGFIKMDEVLSSKDKFDDKGDMVEASACTVIKNVKVYPNLREFKRVLMLTKNKRNAGDKIKAYVVDEMFSVDMTLTVDLRGLKHFLGLRLPNSSWEPMRELARQISLAVPSVYHEYMRKEDRLLPKMDEV